MTRSSNGAPPLLDSCRSLARRLRAALGAASLALVMGSACGDDPAPAPPLDADAGSACERGTRNCACIGGSSCQGELLCIAGRCSLTPESPPESPPPRPRPPPDLDLPEPDAEPPPAPDAGADASVPGGDDPGEAPAPDAGADAG